MIAGHSVVGFFNFSFFPFTGVMPAADSSKKATSAMKISSNVQTSAKKLTLQDEEVALRLLPTTTPAEIKRTLLSESPPDIKTCRIIVAPNSENLLAEDLLIDSGGSKYF